MKVVTRVTRQLYDLVFWFETHQAYGAVFVLFVHPGVKLLAVVQKLLNQISVLKVSRAAESPPEF